MYSKILITGSNGVAGFGFKSIQHMYPDKEFIFSGSKECNLTKQDETLDYVKKCRIDAIIHLAAISGGIELSTRYPATLLRDNILMNLNIMEASRLCKVKKVVMSLSTGMYSDSVPNPILEEYIHNGPPHKSNYSYAFAKRLVDPLIKAYRTEYHLNVIGLIPNGIIGENSNYDYKSSTMLPALIRRFYENRKGNSKLIVWGDGSPLREYTYAEDIARAYMWCLDNYDNEQVLHIGTTEEHTIKEMAYMVADFLKIDKNRIEFDTSKPSGQLRKNTDNSKFVILSNFKYTPLKVGLEKTIRYFCDNYGDKSKIRL